MEPGDQSIAILSRRRMGLFPAALAEAAQVGGGGVSVKATSVA